MVRADDLPASATAVSRRLCHLASHAGDDVFQTLYRSTLWHHPPRAMSVPATTADSHPDWSSDARANGALRRHLLDVLSFDRLERGPLGHILDVSAFELSLLQGRLG